MRLEAAIISDIKTFWKLFFYQEKVTKRSGNFEKFSLWQPCWKDRQFLKGLSKLGP